MIAEKSRLNQILAEPQFADLTKREIADNLLHRLNGLKTAFPDFSKVGADDGDVRELQFVMSALEQNNLITSENQPLVDILKQWISGESKPKAEIDPDAEFSWIDEVVSKPGEYISYLHRTAPELSASIQQNGLIAGGELRSTAHALSNESSARYMLKGSHILTEGEDPKMDGVIMRVPAFLQRLAEKRDATPSVTPVGGSLMDALAVGKGGHYDLNKLLFDEFTENVDGHKQIVIPAEWVYGVVDQKDLTKPPRKNPKYGQPNAVLDQKMALLLQELSSTPSQPKQSFRF